MAAVMNLYQYPPCSPELCGQPSRGQGYDNKSQARAGYGQAGARGGNTRPHGGGSHRRSEGRVTTVLATIPTILRLAIFGAVVTQANCTAAMAEPVTIETPWKRTASTARAILKVGVTPTRPTVVMATTAFRVWPSPSSRSGW